MNIGELAVVVIPFVVSPGASLVLTLEAAVAGDRRAPLRVWAGTALGIGGIALAAGVSGLGEVIARDDVLRTVLGLVGGAILIVFGALSLRGAVSPPKGRVLSPDEAVGTRDRRRDRRRGPNGNLVGWAFLAVITNVKALSLYLLVVPTIAASKRVWLPLYVAFAGIHIVLLFVWLGFISGVVFAAPAIARTSGVQKSLRGSAGAALIVLGVRNFLDVMM